MLVNHLDKNLNITNDTVRFYTRIGLLLPSKPQTKRYKSSWLIINVINKIILILIISSSPMVLDELT